jgi:hypothetical protein
MDFLDARASRDYFATSLGSKEAHGVTVTALDLLNAKFAIVRDGALMD